MAADDRGLFPASFLRVKAPPDYSIIDSLISNGLQLGLGLSFWYSAKFISLESGQYGKFILAHFLGGIISSMFWLGITYIILFSVIKFPSTLAANFTESLPWRILIGLLFYYLISSTYYVYIYYSGYQERSIAEAQLRNLVTEAELKTLKFQINPHFIFNSLNSMSALTVIDPEKARNMILKLADFLRYTLATNDNQKNKLKDELKNIRLYLDIEKIRFEDKFEFHENLSESCTDIEVPNMILQPLFENAIKHAVYETLDKVTLNLVCEREDQFMKITVQNNFETEAESAKGTGTGLKNIENRLKLIYSMDNLLKVRKEENQFSVILYIPITNLS